VAVTRNFNSFSSDFNQFSKSLSIIGDGLAKSGFGVLILMGFMEGVAPPYGAKSYAEDASTQLSVAAP
jgi:hypothetical protein